MSAAEHAYVQRHVEDAVATITLDRPDEANALSEPMQQAIIDALRVSNTDPGSRVVIIVGAGKAFSAGGDLRTMRGGAQSADGVAVAPVDGYAQRAKVQRLQGIVRAVRSCEKPVLAAVHGAAVGGGCDLALACDLRFASTQAQFGEVFVRLGLFPGTGGTYLLPRLVGVAKAMEMIWTGDVIDADEALRIGLVTAVVPPAELMDVVRRFALRLAEGPPLALALAKAAVYRGQDIDFDSALDLAATGESITLSSLDHAEGVAAFVAGRRPRFEGR